MVSSLISSLRDNITLILKQPYTYKRKRHSRAGGNPGRPKGDRAQGAHGSRIFAFANSGMTTTVLPVSSSQRSKGYILVFVVFMIAVLGIMATFLMQQDKAGQALVEQNFWRVSFNAQLYAIEKQLKSNPDLLKAVCELKEPLMREGNSQIRVTCLRKESSTQVDLIASQMDAKPFGFIVSRTLNI